MVTPDGEKCKRMHNTHLSKIGNNYNMKRCGWYLIKIVVQLIHLLKSLTNKYCMYSINN